MPCSRALLPHLGFGSYVRDLPFEGLVLGCVPLYRKGRYASEQQVVGCLLLACVAKDLTQRRCGSWIRSWVRSGDFRWRRKIFGLHSPSDSAFFHAGVRSYVRGVCTTRYVMVAYPHVELLEVQTHSQNPVLSFLPLLVSCPVARFAQQNERGSEALLVDEEGGNNMRSCVCVCARPRRSKKQSCISSRAGGGA
jgi:hypothetical protein